MINETEEFRRDKIRAVIEWLDPIINKAIPNFHIWEKLNPQEAEEFWEHWDLFDRASYGYIMGLVPIDKIRQMALLISSAVERVRV